VMKHLHIPLLLYLVNNHQDTQSICNVKLEVDYDLRLFVIVRMEKICITFLLSWYRWDFCAHFFLHYQIFVVGTDINVCLSCLCWNPSLGLAITGVKQSSMSSYLTTTQVRLWVSIDCLSMTTPGITLWAWILACFLKWVHE
jgi:hypothetical protein